jgi:hypothetical protein
MAKAVAIEMSLALRGISAQDASKLTGPQRRLAELDAGLGRPASDDTWALVVQLLTGAEHSPARRAGGPDER